MQHEVIKSWPTRHPPNPICLPLWVMHLLISAYDADQWQKEEIFTFLEFTNSPKDERTM